VSEIGVYVYGVGRDLPREAGEGLNGVAGASVRVIEGGGLQALVSTVSLGDFGEEALRRNLEDLEWLEAVARAHHAVVDAAAALATVVPLGLAGVYRSEERVREVLRARNEDFTRALGRVTGRTEWGVKVYAEPRRTTTADTAKAKAVADRPGTSYLRRRKVEQETREISRRDLLTMAGDIDGELRELAVAGRLHRLQDPQLSGERGWMILNAAYLVDDERADDLLTAVTRLADLHPEIRLQLTGPWAPYSFAAEEEETWTTP
jgi:hypothetical protein